jgi:hypothetical protein
MMKRREFMAASTVLGLTPWALAGAAEPAAAGRSIYELRTYNFETAEQRSRFEQFALRAAIPALNRAGVRPVGVFAVEEEISPVHVLLPHKSLESVATLVDRLAEDSEFTSRGAEFLEAPASEPAYTRSSSSLMIAFKGMPHVEIPISSADRILELRVYESPSVVTGQKKIEMFNDAGEIAIFRRVGLHPVFFGETIIGDKMPNLTYMLAFESMQQRQENWKKFGGDPDWQRLKSMDEYADKNILSKITKTFLKPVGGSQI